MSDGQVQRWVLVHQAAVRAGNEEDADYARQQIERLTREATATEVEQEGLVQAPSGEIQRRVSPVAALAQGAAQSASLGIGSLLSPETREFVRAAETQRPGLTLAGRVVGGLVGPGAEIATARAGLNVLRAAPKVRQAANVLAAGANPLRVIRNPILRNVLTGGGYGAGVGAVTGAAEAEPGRRAEAARRGAAVGGAFGAAIPATSVTGLALLGRLRVGGRKVRQWAREALGEPAPQRPATQAPTRPPSEEEILSRIQRAGRLQGQRDVVRLGLRRPQAQQQATSRTPGSVVEREAPVRAPATPTEVQPAPSQGAPKPELRTRQAAPPRQPRIREPKASTARAAPAAESPPKAPATATGLETGKTTEEAATKAARGLREGAFKRGPGRNPMPPEVEATVRGARTRRMMKATGREGEPISVVPVSKPAVRAAREKVAAQQEAGLRGPRGGMKIGSQANVREGRLRDLAERIRTFSPEQLRQELDNPFVEDWVKEAVRRELTRRAG